jgi:hypothetical protein
MLLRREGGTLNITCKTCEQGTLRHRKRYRLSGPAVFLGYVIGVPSGLGLILAGLLFLLTGSATASSSDTIRTSMAQDLVDRGLPAAVASRAVTGPPFSRAELERMPEDHQRMIELQRSAQLGADAGAGLFALMGGGASLCVGVSSLFGLLIGYLLTMTKRVLECTACGATLAAS